MRLSATAGAGCPAREPCEHEAADRFHTVRQTQWRETGDVTITLVCLPENGEATV
jgi:hypothetical protein